MLNKPHCSNYEETFVAARTDAGDSSQIRVVVAESHSVQIALEVIPVKGQP